MCKNLCLLFIKSKSFCYLVQLNLLSRTSIYCCHHDLQDKYSCGKCRCQCSSSIQPRATQPSYWSFAVMKKDDYPRFFLSFLDDGESKHTSDEHQHDVLLPNCRLIESVKFYMISRNWIDYRMGPPIKETFPYRSGQYPITFPRP